MDYFETIDDTRTTHTPHHKRGFLNRRRIAKFLIFALLLSVIPVQPHTHAEAATTNCSTCNGKGTIACPMTGDMDHTHYLYKQHMVNGEYHSWACWTCGNDGRIDKYGEFACYICDPANPQVDLDNNYYIGCTNCGGQGRCPSCGANQYSMPNCKTCEGKGRCTTCNGSGKDWAKRCTLCGSDKYGGKYIGIIGSEECTNCGAAGYIYCWKCPHCGVCDDSHDHVQHATVDCPDCEDGTVEAYTITVNANPTNGGTTSGSGTYEEGSTITISATAKEGWVFDGWSDGDKSSSRPVTVSSDKTYTANFRQSKPTNTPTSTPFPTPTPALSGGGEEAYVVYTSAEPAEGGSTSGGGTYKVGTSANIIATANPGWTFVKWNYTKSSISYTYVKNNANTTVTSNKVGEVINCVAKFEKSNNPPPPTDGPTNTPTPTSKPTSTPSTTTKVTVSTSCSPSDGGSLSGGGEYEKGTSITVVATANPGWKLIKIEYYNDETGNLASTSTSSSMTKTINGNRSFIAYFEEDESAPEITDTPTPEVTPTPDPTATPTPVVSTSYSSYSATITIDPNGGTFNNYPNSSSINIYTSSWSESTTTTTFDGSTSTSCKVTREYPFTKQTDF